MNVRLISAILIPSLLLVAAVLLPLRYGPAAAWIAAALLAPVILYGCWAIDSGAGLRHNARAARRVLAVGVPLGLVAFFAVKAAPAIVSMLF